jgi:RibD C-terminal domain
MLIYSMSVSVDGFIATVRAGSGGRSRATSCFVSTPRKSASSAPICSGAGSTRRCWCGRRIPSLRDTELRAAFADVWCAIPKVVFSRTLDSVQGNARLAEASVADEAAAALDATDKDVSIGGAGLAAAAIELGLVDELRMFRHPIVVGGGTPFLPPVTEDVPLDLIEARTFGSRVIFERYGRARDESD